MLNRNVVPTLNLNLQGDGAVADDEQDGAGDAPVSYQEDTDTGDEGADLDESGAHAGADVDLEVAGANDLAEVADQQQDEDEEESPHEAEIRRLEKAIMDKDLQISRKDREIARLKDEGEAKDSQIWKQRQRAEQHRDKAKTLKRALGRARFKRNKLRKNPLKDAVRSELLKMNSRAKTNFIMGKKKRPGNWTREEIVQALVLRNMSKRAYKLTRKMSMMALPGLSTLRRWIRHFKIEPGLLKRALEMLGKWLRVQESERYKPVCVSFDEMTCNQDLSLSQAEQQVLPSAKKFHVSMVRGVIHSFKQHVWCGFDEDMTKDTLEEIIEAVEAQGFRVVAAVSDFATPNQALWKKLGVNMEKPSFKHPFDSSRDIHVFADFPHMLKLLRNHYLDKGFVLPSGTKFIREDLEELLEVDPIENELRLERKLSSTLFDVKGSARQKVKYATKLFSNTTAELLAAARPEKKDQYEFVKLTNDVFDVMNSRIPEDKSNNLKSGYGKFKQQQDAVLDRMYNMVTKMRQIGKKPGAALIPFQRGIAWSIKSAKNLFNSLKEEYNISYLLTCHVNQDCVENTFSCIRGIGARYNNPHPTECLNRLRLLMIGSKELQNFVIDKSAVEAEDIVEEFDDGAQLLSAELQGDDELQPTPTEQEEEEWEDIDNDVDEEEDESQAIEPDTEYVADEGDEEDYEALIDDGELPSLTPHECSEEALKTVAGWLAHACRAKHYDLGTPTARTPAEVMVNFPWLARISRGGLKVPEAWFLELVRQWESHFNSFHGGKLKVSHEKWVIKKQFKGLCAMSPNSGLEDVMLKFATFRLHVRIKYLNLLRRDAAKEKSDARRSAMKAREHMDLPS